MKELDCICPLSHLGRVHTVSSGIGPHRNPNIYRKGWKPGCPKHPEPESTEVIEFTADGQLKITFDRKHYLFNGSPDLVSGAISTADQWENFRDPNCVSELYLFADGTIRRFQKVVGRKEDIRLGWL